MERSDPVPVTGVSELVLEVRDLEAAERFYIGVLGLHLVRRRAGDRTWLLAGDRTRLGLWSPQTGIAGGRGGSHVHFALHIPDGAYEETAAQLRGHGVRVHEEDFRADGRGRALYVDDPDGNVVELWTFDVARELDEPREASG